MLPGSSREVPRGKEARSRCGRSEVGWAGSMKGEAGAGAVAGGQRCAPEQPRSRPTKSWGCPVGPLRRRSKGHSDAWPSSTTPTSTKQ